MNGCPLTGFKFAFFPPVNSTNPHFLESRSSTEPATAPLPPPPKSDKPKNETNFEVCLFTFHLQQRLIASSCRIYCHTKDLSNSVGILRGNLKEVIARKGELEGMVEVLRQKLDQCGTELVSTIHFKSYSPKHPCSIPCSFLCSFLCSIPCSIPCSVLTLTVTVILSFFLFSETVEEQKNLKNLLERHMDRISQLNHTVQEAQQTVLVMEHLDRLVPDFSILPFYFRLRRAAFWSFSGNEMGKRRLGIGASGLLRRRGETVTMKTHRSTPSQYFSFLLFSHPFPTLSCNVERQKF